MDGRRDHLLVATLPLLLGAHQLVEAFVWWGLQGQVTHEVQRAALWIYLLIAFVVLPAFVPYAVLATEASRARRRRMVPFVLVGGAVAAVFLGALVRGPVHAELHPDHLAYHIPLRDGGLGVALYVVAVCGPLLLSGERRMRVFGVANLAAVVILARLTADGFASLWCMYAALASGAVALHMRATAAPRERRSARLTSV